MSKLILLVAILFLLSLSIFAVDIIDNTNTDFNQGTFFNTKVQGTGADTNVTLNYIVNTGNMSGGHLIYNVTGNFTSEINDTGSTSTTFDRISWAVNLPNSSDVIGVTFDQGAFDAAIFLRNSSYISNTSTNGTYDINFVRFNKYTIPANFDYNDILGFAHDTPSSDAAVFFRNGSFVTDASQLDYNSQVNFVNVKAYSLVANFNTSDIIGFAYDSDVAGDDVAAFFKNGSYVADIVQSSLNINIKFDTVWSYFIPNGFSYDDIMGFTKGSGVNSICALFNNKSIVCDVVQDNLNSVVNLTKYFTATYPSDINLTTRTNISIFTQISNDSTTWTSWTEYTVINDGSYAELNAAINTSQNVGRYIRYKTEFKTTDKYFTPQLLNVTINYTAVEVEADTCTAPGSGDWTISDNCTFNTAQNVVADMVFNDDAPLSVVLSAAITFTGSNQKIVIHSPTTIDIRSGGQFG